MPLSQIDPSSGLAVAPGPGLLATKKLPPSVAEWATDQAEVAAFCERHDVFDEAELAVALARKHFGHGRMNISVNAHHDEADPWLTIEVGASGTLEKVRQAYDAYVHDWLRRVSDDKLLLVRLDYNFQ